MSATGLEVFDDTIQKTNIWLKEIGETLGRDNRRLAYRALRAVLHALRDRMTIEEAAHLSAELPMLVRGIFYEQYRPTDMPAKIREQQEFLDLINREIADAPELPPQEAAKAVFLCLNRHLDPHQAIHARDMMPESIRRLWPEVAKKAA
jgi:uncharacterized protein (DUF2267 family)